MMRPNSLSTHATPTIQSGVYWQDDVPLMQCSGTDICPTNKFYLAMSLPVVKAWVGGDSPVVDNESHAWVVDFNNGNVNHNAHDNDNHVRLVRAGGVSE